MQALPVVYIDIVWMVNFIMDFALLWTTGWLMKRRARWTRLLAGALVGATYALALFVPALSLATTWPGKALVSVLMVWVSLPHRSALDLARLVGVYYLVSFVVAGRAWPLGSPCPARRSTTPCGATAAWPLRLQARRSA